MYAPRLKLMFSHRALQILLGLWVIGWIIVIRSGSWGLLWLVPLGFIGQMLNEYSMHRYLFHWPAPRSP